MLTQDRALAWLRTPAAYAGLSGEPVQHVDIRETHGAIIFLAGSHAIKVKRAVKLAYLDFSTLSQREAACRRELEVNTPNAPAIYQDLVAVVLRSTDGLELKRECDLSSDDKATIVEWGVLMRRFPDGTLMSDLAGADTLDPTAGLALGDMIHAMHQRCPVSHDANAVARLHTVIEDIAAAFQRENTSTLEASKFRLRADTLLAQLTPLLQRRLAGGFVRRCHGDLHLANLIWLDGRPVAFDAIEFDESIATIDVLYDLAFTLMDFDRLGMAGQGNALLNRWQWRAGSLEDLDGLAAMPLFLALRAGIRAMVDLDRTRQLPNAEAHSVRAEAQRYLMQALDYMTPAPPRLIAVGGLSGSGKSTLAARLAPQFGCSPGALHLRSDLERKALLCLEETERAAPDTYTPEWSARTYERLQQRAQHALMAGHSVIVDAVFARSAERGGVEGIARKTNVPFQGLWLDAAPNILVARVANRHGDASDATPKVVEAQLDYDLGSLTWDRIAADGVAAATEQIARTRLGL